MFANFLLPLLGKICKSISDPQACSKHFFKSWTAGKFSSENDHPNFSLASGINGILPVHVPTRCIKREINISSITMEWINKKNRPKNLVPSIVSFLPCCMIVKVSVIQIIMFATASIIKEKLRNSSSFTFSCSLELKAACSGNRQASRSRF